MRSQSWPAPAKLNLFLHILGRRDDGYHLLQTVFQFINLIDEIDFNILDKPEVCRLSSMDSVPEQDDLVIRAAKLLQCHTACEQGVEISVNKRIPHGGGLGGGSSDAATTLVALNHLWKLNLDKAEIAKLGLSLGADVPVFVSGHAAWAEGVGEQLAEVGPDESCYLVIHPGCSVPTAQIFNASDLTRNTPAITIRDFLADGGHNDCESVVRKLYPEVDTALEWLNEFSPAKLTGTGACLFAAFNNMAAATEAQRGLPEKWQGYVVQGLNRSPLMDRLEKESSV